MAFGSSSLVCFIVMKESTAVVERDSFVDSLMI